MRLKIINGPNLNFLGKREPKVYGTSTLADLEKQIKEKFSEIEIIFFQTNYEGAIIDQIQASANDQTDGILINAGALTHYSYSIRDAIASVNIPVVEIHISNIFAREDFRRMSVISEVCVGIISGFGLKSYELAVRYFIDLNVKN